MFAMPMGLNIMFFQWSDINTMAPVGTIDMLKISSCSVKSQNINEICLVVETLKDKAIPQGLTPNPSMDNNRYEILANNPDECKFYVNALNYLSQLVKCKAYAYKGLSEKNKK